MVRDPATGLSKGFGFVRFSDPTEATAAIAGLSNRRMEHGRCLAVRIAGTTGPPRDGGGGAGAGAGAGAPPGPGRGPPPMGGAPPGGHPPQWVQGGACPVRWAVLALALERFLEKLPPVRCWQLCHAYDCPLIS